VAKHQRATHINSVKQHIEKRNRCSAGSNMAAWRRHEISKAKAAAKIAASKKNIMAAA